MSDYYARRMRDMMRNAGTFRLVFVPPSETKISEYYIPEIQCAACDGPMAWDRAGWWYCGGCGSKVDAHSMQASLVKVRRGLEIIEMDTKLKLGKRGLLWRLVNSFRTLLSKILRRS